MVSGHWYSPYMSLYIYNQESSRGGSEPELDYPSSVRVLVQVTGYLCRALSHIVIEGDWRHSEKVPLDPYRVLIKSLYHYSQLRNRGSGSASIPDSASKALAGQLQHGVQGLCGDPLHRVARLLGVWGENPLCLVGGATIGLGCVGLERYRSAGSLI